MSELLDVRPQPPRRSRRRGNGRLVAAVLVLVLLLVGVAVGGVLLLDRLGGPEVADYEGTGTGEAVVQVMPGDTAGAVAERLAAQGVVASAAAFRQAAIADPDSKGLQPGTYRLRQRMSGAAALELLLDPSSRIQGRVVVPEGLRVEQVLQRIADATDIELADLQAAAADPSGLGVPAWAESDSLEGFLFPATYEVEPGTTAEQMLRTMVERFQQAAQEVQLESKAAALGRTPYEVLIVASLIEREVRFDDEYPRVAQVVYNRLEQGERIDIDAAVLYGLGRTSGGLTRSDLEKDTPYNLRRKRGLPPTPISSPGVATLTGALNPSGGDELFYVLSTKEGRSTFTTNLRDHNRAVAKAKAEGIF